MYAVGNAAFHTSELYAHLETAVPSLSETLRGDEDEKTRANAAGALGNFARNGPELCPALCREGCADLLVRVAAEDASVFPRVFFGIFITRRELVLCSFLLSLNALHK